MPAGGYNQRKPKLSLSDVNYIRDLILERESLLEKANNLTYKKIGEKFGVCYQTVSRIALGEIHHPLRVLKNKKPRIRKPPSSHIAE